MSNLVVAHYLDGRMVKGTSVDVDPNKPLCHIRTRDGKMAEVQLTDLKALFFVRDLDGNPKRRDSKRPNPEDVRLRGAKSVALSFKDGEKLVGATHHYPPTRPFFFVVPVDPNDNNIRVLVNRSSLASVGPGPALPVP
ncbi:MAG TPA: hypothetical protein VMS93_08660 [Candidatus Saccharimonadales bacterium]|nr:hypothetical protein [Candidatus Saccharimonadales bacterium]